MGRIILAAIAAAAISGCTVRHVPPTPDEAATLEWASLRASARRGLAESYQAIPFADGPISVVAPDRGELRTFRLVPCGADVCASSAHGSRGTLQRTLDYWVVRGLYGREFWLSPGGDGGLRGPGRPDTWLAWGDVAPPPMGGQSGLPPMGGQSGPPPMGGQSGLPPMGGQSGLPPMGGY